MQFKNIFLLFLVFLSLVSSSQVKIGEWRDHLSYNYANSVTKVGEIVYSSNGSGLIKYNEGDNSIEKLTKINGLSDIGVKLLRKNEYNNSVLAVYDNTNIDIILASEKIINVSDIKRKIIQGKKTINEVYFSGSLAYISCGFGIVVFDTEKLEVKDTYYLGNGISNLEIFNVATNDTAIFAATPAGVFYGKLTQNLNNFQNWISLNTGIASGPYNSIVNFNGKIIANYSERLKSNASLKDTLYELTNLGWKKYSINMYHTGTENKKMFVNNKTNHLFIIDQFNNMAQFEVSGARTNYIADYGFDDAEINDGYFDNSKYWLADRRHGLVKSLGAFAASEKIKVNGPTNNVANDIDILDGKLVVAPVNLGETYNSQYLMFKPNVYQDGEWRQISLPDSIKDVNSVTINPKDKEHVSFGCMSSGILETKSDQIQNVFVYGNSPLIGYNSTSDVRITGVKYDKNSNLWASITLGKKCVAVRKPNNSWTLLDFEQFVVQPTVSKILFDKQDQAWIILPRNVGVMVYKDVNGLSQPNASNTKLLSKAIGNGQLPSVDVHSVCEDEEGHIWLGTAKGVAVFYNPENIFTGANWDSQQILIEQDGQIKILLENDIINSIAVDGVNQKWIGTENSGVYCLSSDGQKEIYHFTAENSPLYSNLIRDIVVDETTGDVFFATDKGIQSYRTPIIRGYEDYTKVHAFPNPVRPGFSGPVCITGLIDESDVKITDVSGNLIWSTKSQGGQVIWNLQSFAGTKAASGVYMIYCASATGDKSATAKLLIVN
jgi:hypothetical protein